MGSAALLPRVTVDLAQKPIAPSPTASLGLRFQYQQHFPQFRVDSRTPSSIARKRFSPRSLTLSGQTVDPGVSIFPCPMPNRLFRPYISTRTPTITEHFSYRIGITLPTSIGMLWLKHEDTSIIFTIYLSLTSESTITMPISH